MTKKDDKKKSHLGSGLMLGAAIAVAAAAFLQTKRGKEVKKDIEKKLGSIQKKLKVELKKAKAMTKEGYEELVDNVIDYYVKTKDVAKAEVPGVKKELMKSWKTIEKEMKTTGKKIAKTSAASGKRIAKTAKASGKTLGSKAKKATKKVVKSKSKK